MSIRNALVGYVKSFDKVGVTKNKKQYFELLASDDPADRTPQMEAYFTHPTTSGCALATRGWWRDLGLKHARLGAYKIGMAVADVIQIGKDHGAWVPSYDFDRYALEAGDCVVVQGPEHVFTVTSVSVLNTADGRVTEYELKSIDGGQQDGKGNQIILAKTRRLWRDKDGVWWDRPKDDLYKATRRLMGVIDVSKLPFPSSQPTEEVPPPASTRRGEDQPPAEDITAKFYDELETK